MANFSVRSARRLETCHPDIITLFDHVVITYDCTILCGIRDEEAQTEAYTSGGSKVEYPNSTHNREPSDGVDVAPWPIPDKWGEFTLSDLRTGDVSIKEVQHQIKELAKFYQFAGIVIGEASIRGIEMRWGGDWDGDGEFDDQTFDDLVHFERVRRPYEDFEAVQK